MSWFTRKQFLDHVKGSVSSLETLPTSIKNAPLPEGIKGILKSGTVEVRESDDSGGDKIVLEFIHSTDTIDRHNDTVAIDGWELDHFKGNPVFLFAHLNQLPPIGKALGMGVSGSPKALRSKVEFTPKDLNPFGDMIGRMFQQGFMNAVSVGFRALEWSFNEERGDWAFDFKRQELLESSAVPVPANPQALIQARSAGIDMNPMMEWAEQGKGVYVSEEKFAEIYSALKAETTTVDLGASVPKAVNDDEELDMLGLSEKATANLKDLVKAKGADAVSKALEADPKALMAEIKAPEDDELVVCGEDGVELSDEEVGELIGAAVKESVNSVRTEVLGTVD